MNGIWSTKIVPEAGSLKTAGSERVVPLHPAVLEAGFLQFVAKLPPGPLFPALTPDVFGLPLLHSGTDECHCEETHYESRR